jgi:hypothetical protein
MSTQAPGLHPWDHSRTTTRKLLLPLLLLHILNLQITIDNFFQKLFPRSINIYSEVFRDANGRFFRGICFSQMSAAEN